MPNSTLVLLAGGLALSLAFPRCSAQDVSGPAHKHHAKSASTSITLLIEPAQGHAALYTLVNQAAKTIDMTMYELVDTTFSADLVAACQRGVQVRVILDQNLEKASNLPAFTQLNAQPNCTAAWANPAFQATHQKSLIVDGVTLALLTFNLTSIFYPTSRDFAILEAGPADIAAVQATFNADFRSTTDFTFKPPPGDDLLWSPTTAQAALLRIIKGATKTLLVENEEMGAPNIVSALEAACRKGVAVQITMTANTAYAANFAALRTAGCGVHLYPNTPTGLYIHAKILLADYALATQKLYLGSINFSLASMTKNRELGLTLTNPAIARQIHDTLTADYAGAPASTPSQSSAPPRP